MTSFWFAVSVGGEKSETWLRLVVTDVQEALPGDVWSITFLQSNGVGSQTRSVSTVYVLEATCEVIGHCPDTSQTPELERLSLSPLRADWAAYVHSQMQFPAHDRSPLLSQLKWTHFAEYNQGISRLWLTRIAKEGDEGIEKRRFAERYVLASVVANSVSGRWMSNIDMVQDFAGIPSKYGFSSHKPHTPQSVNLYLPEHHHVESVHFTASTGSLFHPALVTVQTPGREYFVLKDNGMEVGCEEDGVSALWMELLGCDNKGFRVQ